MEDFLPGIVVHTASNILHQLLFGFQSLLLLHLRQGDFLVPLGFRHFDLRRETPSKDALKIWYKFNFHIILQCKNNLAIHEYIK